MYIVGIDIAKRSHEAIVIDSDGTTVVKPFSFTNNCSGYNKLMSILKKAKLDFSQLSFAMEATGHYWLALLAHLQKAGFQIQVINPVQTNSIRNFYIRQAKTDPRDALLIAEVIRFGNFTETNLHPTDIYSLRELCRGRHSLVAMASDLKRKIIALLDQVFPEYEQAFSNIFGLTSLAILKTCPTPTELASMDVNTLCELIAEPSRKRFGLQKAGELQEMARNSFGFEVTTEVFSSMIKLYVNHLCFVQEQVEQVDAQISALMGELHSPLVTVTGVGPVLAACILSEIGDISRFNSAEKLAAYAGVDPTMRQSGEYNGIRNRMSKRGSPYLRYAIWIASTVASIHDPAIHAYYLKKRAEGKPHMTTIGHICRKMVSIIFAVLRDNKAYVPFIPQSLPA